jgi:hypothetical protein
MILTHYREMAGVDRELDMPAIGVTLPLADFHNGVEFPARPRLVRMDEPRETTAVTGTAHRPTGQA